MDNVSMEVETCVLRLTVGKIQTPPQPVAAALKEMPLPEPHNDLDGSSDDVNALKAENRRAIRHQL